jgi:hypothetical protein
MNDNSINEQIEMGKRNFPDKEIIERLEKLAEKRPFAEVMFAFPGYINRYNLTRMLAYFELFKMVQHKPGWIVECGVYRGFSLFALAKFMEIFCMGDKSRKVLGFDNFTGFTELSREDGKKDEKIGKSKGGISPSEYREDVMELMEICNQDAFAPWAKRVEIIEGDVEKTIPKYVIENPGLRISLLHLDIDLYQPTFVALKNLYPLIVPGGVVVLDQYAHKDWGGESKALEDYLRLLNTEIPELKTFTWCSTPTTYFTKK